MPQVTVQRRISPQEAEALLQEKSTTVIVLESDYNIRAVEVYAQEGFMKVGSWDHANSIYINTSHIGLEPLVLLTKDFV